MKGSGLPYQRGALSHTMGSNHSWCRNQKLFPLALLLALTASPQPALGQAEQGTITGTVRDSSGAVIPAAKVTAQEVSTHTVSATVSNGNGYYTIPYLAPGTYDVTAEATGFSTAVVSGST
ncbi:MAG TPA: carboxypeptidase-like regulatory domain-containing protein [Acidobacteriaceae bacterium]